MKTTTKDLTKGTIWKQLIAFAIPLIWGNLFQLTYNMVDSIVVGQFAGQDALAAVGTSDPIMNLLILGVTGLCIGASVIMSNCFGAGKTEELKHEVGMTLLLVMGMSAVILVGGWIASEGILKLMQTPIDILPLAESYLHIIFVGMPFTCLYNIYAASLRSVGDAKTPVYFLVLSSVLNGALDVLFVAGLHMGVAGAGLATVIAEAVSAVLCVIYVYFRVPMLHLKKQHFQLDKRLIWMTVQYGGMSSLQQCSQPLGKLLIQGAINTLGVGAMAAFNAVGKIEDFALVPGRSISNAMMTFTAQNDGAKKPKRIKDGFRSGIMLEICYAVFICAVLLLFDKQLIGLFGDSKQMLSEGSRYFAVMAFFYWLPGVTNAHQGFLRGVGKMKMTLYGTLTQITFRVIFTFLLVPRIGLVGVGFACIAGWIAMLCWQAPYCIHIRKKMMTERKENYDLQG